MSLISTANYLHILSRVVAHCPSLINTHTHTLICSWQKASQSLNFQSNPAYREVMRQIMQWQFSDQSLSLQNDSTISQEEKGIKRWGVGFKCCNKDIRFICIKHLQLWSGRLLSLAWQVDLHSPPSGHLSF